MLAHASSGCRASFNVPRTHFAVISQSLTSLSRKCLHKQIHQVQSSSVGKKKKKKVEVFSGAEGFMGEQLVLGVWQRWTVLTMGQVFG